MVTLLLDNTQLEVVLSPIERAASFRRENLRIERHAIVKVQLTEEPWTWLRGTSNPGTYVPRMFAAGTWSSARGQDFVLVRRRRPAVVIDLEDAEYQRLVLSTRHGLALAQALHLDVTNEPTDVIDIAGTAPIPVASPPRRGKRTSPVAKPV